MVECMSRERERGAMGFVCVREREALSILECVSLDFVEREALSFLECGYLDFVEIEDFLVLM